ncbi:hypothetical protein SKAU_G00177270 [Synaphobranchus kaupii]|uniref:Uncharacterized protein n=1 Tax=Synaphobranchus kaupii TaxID=118154 RepID=A0A9Q1J1F5_SYNKA|nr:hypothetical protein SKAU_G00177270 [Synaphobranchus kaupii]
MPPPPRATYEQHTAAQRVFNVVGDGKRHTRSPSLMLRRSRNMLLSNEMEPPAGLSTHTLSIPRQLAIKKNGFRLADCEPSDGRDK